MENKDDTTATHQNKHITRECNTTRDTLKRRNLITAQIAPTVYVVRNLCDKPL
jgi:hypothetical protein